MGARQHNQEGRSEWIIKEALPPASARAPLRPPTHLLPPRLRWLPTGLRVTRAPGIFDYSQFG